MEQAIAHEERHEESALRLLGLLSGTAGVIAAIIFALQAWQSDFVRVPGGVPVSVGSHLSGIMVGSATGCLVAGIINAVIFTKFATGLELLHEIRANQKGG